VNVDLWGLHYLHGVVQLRAGHHLLPLHGHDLRVLCQVLVLSPLLLHQDPSADCGRCDASNWRQEQRRYGAWLLRLMALATSALSLETADIDIEKYRAVEKFFYKTYAPFTFKYRRYIVAGFVLFFAVALGFATQLEASETPAQFLPDSDPLQVT